MDAQTLIVPGLLLLAIIGTWIDTRREIARIGERMGERIANMGERIANVAERVARIEGVLATRQPEPPTASPSVE